MPLFVAAENGRTEVVSHRLTLGLLSGTSRKYSDHCIVCSAKSELHDFCPPPGLDPSTVSSRLTLGHLSGTIRKYSAHRIVCPATSEVNDLAAENGHAEVVSRRLTLGHLSGFSRKYSYHHIVHDFRSPPGLDPSAPGGKERSRGSGEYPAEQVDPAAAREGQAGPHGAAHGRRQRPPGAAQPADWPGSRHQCPGWGTRFPETVFTLFNPFTPKSDQFQVSPAASPEIRHHTVWFLHSLLRWKMIILTILTTSLVFGRLGEYTFWTWEWKATSVSYTNFVSWTQKTFLKIFRNIWSKVRLTTYFTSVRHRTAAPRCTWQQRMVTWKWSGSSWSPERRPGPSPTYVHFLLATSQKYMTSLPLVNVCHHRRVTRWKLTSPVFLVYNSGWSKCIELTYY